MSNKNKAMYRSGLWILLVAMIVLCGLGWGYWTSVPSLKASGDALKTIDSLFTAINSRDANRVALCKARLSHHANSGQLSSVAMVELANCCEQACSGDWEDAARRLYRVIEKQ